MAKVFAQGTLVQIGDGGAPETFTTIPNVGEITGPDTQNEDIETTDHSSPAGTREFVGGLKDPGELTFPIAWDYNEATHAGLKADHDNRTQRNFQLVDQASPQVTASFTGEVAGLANVYPVEGIQQATVRIRISGVVSYA